MTISVFEGPLLCHINSVQERSTEFNTSPYCSIVFIMIPIILHKNARLTCFQMAHSLTVYRKLTSHTVNVNLHNDRNTMKEHLDYNKFNIPKCDFKLIDIHQALTNMPQTNMHIIKEPLGQTSAASRHIGMYIRLLSEVE